jgi:hypothetical protein
MRIRKTLAIAGVGVSLAAAAALPATASTSHAAAKHPASKGTFHSTVSPTTVHPGQTITLRAHGAKKRTSYTCVIVVVKGANYGIGHILGAKTSSKRGKLTCSGTFQPFKAVPAKGGKARHCPTTKKDRRAGWKCGFAASTLNKKSNTISYFTARKH